MKLVVERQSRGPHAKCSSMPVFVNFTGTQPRPFIYVWSLAAFTVLKQSSIVVPESGPQILQYFMSGLLQKRS